LLCSMICALHRDSRENLPNERVELYKQCVDMLLTKRDEGRKVALGPEYAQLKPGQQLALVQNFAYWMMRNGYSDVSVEEADQHFEAKLPDLDAPEADGKKVRRFFAERTNLLREPVDDRIDFTHRTFQEFLAAQQAVKDNDFGFLREKATDDQWRELIILAAGVARPKEAATLLRGLVGRGQKLKRAELRHRVLLLAIACLETCVDLDAATRAYVIDQVGSIFPPKDDDEARLVAAAGDPAVPLLRFDPALAAFEAVACVRALAQIGSTAAMKAISEYMAHSDNQVIEAIIDAWDLFDRAEYARQVLAQSTSLVIPTLTSWEGFEHLRHLNALAIGELAPGVDLEPLRQCVALTTLSIGTDVPEDSFRISQVGLTILRRQLHQPRQTQVSEAKESLALIDLTPVAGLSALKQVSLSHSRISDLSPLASSINLTELTVSSSKVSDLSPLAALTNLTELTVSNSKVSDLLPLATLTNLTQLDMRNSSVSDLSPLAALTNLTRLFVSGSAISDLSPLAALTNLTQLYVDNSAVSDLSPLAALTNLTQLYVSRNKLLDRSQIAKLTIRMPQLKVIEY
jgi:hypothetical protein